MSLLISQNLQPVLLLDSTHMSLFLEAEAEKPSDCYVILMKNYSQPIHMKSCRQKITG